MNRLKARYLQSVTPALTKEFGYKSPMAVPKIRKIVSGTIMERRAIARCWFSNCPPQVT